MKINSIYITILLIIILILLIIYCCYYYNSENNIENYTNLDCTNYRNGNYCKQIGEENLFWCFIKKMFCFIIYLKNQITTKDEVIKSKDTQIVNLEDEVVVLDKKIAELNSSIETIENAIKESDGENTVPSEALIESEKKRLELEEEKSRYEIKRKNLLNQINDLQYNENILKEEVKDKDKEIHQSLKEISDLSKNVTEYKKNEDSIVDVCKIDIKDIEDENVKKQVILNKLKEKCDISDNVSDTSDNLETQPDDEDSNLKKPGKTTPGQGSEGKPEEENVQNPQSDDGSCEEGFYKNLTTNTCIAYSELECNKDTEYESVSRSSTSDRRCTPLDECDVGTFVTNIERTITENRNCSPCPDGSYVKANNLKAMPNCGDAIANYYKVGNSYEACQEGTTSNPGATSVDDCISGRKKIGGFADMDNDNDQDRKINKIISPSTPGNPSPPSSTPGNPSPPSSTPGNPSPPPSTPGNPSPPPSTPGNPSPPSSTPGNPSPPPSTPGNPSPPPENNILPTAEDTLTFKEKCIDQCLKSKCLDLNTDCTSIYDNTCRKDCNKHNGFTLDKCPDFDCKSNSIKNTIQDNYNNKMSLLLNASEVNMNFPKANIENTDTELNCDVKYTYVVYDSNGNEKLSGNNIRNFKFEKNDLDCSYTLLNMSMGQVSEENMESNVGSIDYKLPNQNPNYIKNQVLSSSKTGKTEASSQIDNNENNI